MSVPIMIVVVCLGIVGKGAMDEEEEGNAVEGGNASGKIGKEIG